MLEVLFSIVFVYLFILLGYLAKARFKERIDTQTLTLMSVYFLQPFVSVWGFSSAPLQGEHLQVVAIYWGIIALLLVPTALFAKRLFDDPKERSIFTIAGFVGNTGNIGIPLGIALFGQESVIYTTLINLANVFVVYIIGVYVYSRGSFSIKTSLLNILKIPIIPASGIAILINVLQIPLPEQIRTLFTMGAYGGIVLQLFLLGSFLYGSKLYRIDTKLLISVLSQKFLIVPLASALILSLTSLPSFVQAVILMEMLTPLAVANINLASLYGCKPQSVTALIVLSTLAFIVILALFEHFIIPLYMVQ